MTYLVQIDKAYHKIKPFDNASVEFGKGEHGGFAFKLTKETVDESKDYRIRYELIHYGTLIVRVVYNFTTNHLIISLGDGYSQTDRNNINALLQSMEIYITNASIKKKELMLNYNGYRTKELICYMGDSNEV